MFAVGVFAVAMLAAVAVWFILEAWAERSAANRFNTGVPHGTLISTASGIQVMVFCPPWWDVRAWAWYVFIFRFGNWLRRVRGPTITERVSVLLRGGLVRREPSSLEGTITMMQIVGGEVRKLNLRVVDYDAEKAKRGAAPYWHWKQPKQRRRAG